jgi:hypothetical protein
MGSCRQEAEVLQGVVRNWVDNRSLLWKLFENDLLFSGISLSELPINEGDSLATPVAVSQAEMQIQALNDGQDRALKWCVQKAKNTEEKL